MDEHEFKLKIQNGTPRSTENLCKTCRNSHIVDGTNMERVVMCNANWSNPVRVNFQVERCSEYKNKCVPSLGDMREIAWIVESRKRGQMGFAGETPEIQIVPPKKRDEEDGPAMPEDRE